MKLKLLFLCLFLAVATAQSAPMDTAKLQPPLPRNIWIELNKKINPGVIGIYVEFKRFSRSRRQYRDPLFDFLEEFFGPGFDMQTPQNQEERKPIGTGFIIRSDGLIITNNHVADAGQQHQLKVNLPGKKGELVNAEIVGRDYRGDIALLKINTKEKLPVLELGDSNKLQVGEYVAAFGNPFGHSNSMTMGIVSALGREIKELNRFPFIQTDAMINPGNSGGPLVDTRGYVVGVNTAIDARAQGIGFAIPINYVKRILPTIEKEGTVSRGFLGIGLMSLTPRRARQLGAPGKTGILITEVAPGSPAQKAGLRPYDILTHFESQPIKSADDLTQKVQDTPVGKRVDLKILRSVGNTPYKEKTVTVSIGEYPDRNRRARRRGVVKPPPPPPKMIPRPAQPKKQSKYKGRPAPHNLGFSVEDSSSGVRRDFNVPVESSFGPVVVQVDPGSKAEKAGLKPGDVVLKVNSVAVNRSHDVFKNLTQKTNLLEVSRQKETLKFLLKSD